MTFAYYMYESKYIKYNSLYKIENYRDLAWCCKANFKTNLPRLETKQEKPCLYNFKYINCKGEL